MNCKLQTTAEMTVDRVSGLTKRELVTKSIMDAYVSAQQTALKTPASFYIKIDEATDYTTTSASFTTINNASEMTATITTAGGTVWIFFNGEINASSSAKIDFEILVDSAAYVGNDGIGCGNIATATGILVSIAVPVTGLAAGSHTFNLQWKTSAGTATLYAGAGTSTHDTHPYFSGIEMG